MQGTESRGARNNFKERSEFFVMCRRKLFARVCACVCSGASNCVSPASTNLGVPFLHVGCPTPHSPPSSSFVAAIVVVRILRRRTQSHGRNMHSGTPSCDQGSLPSCPPHHQLEVVQGKLRSHGTLEFACTWRTCAHTTCTCIWLKDLSSATEQFVGS